MALPVAETTRDRAYSEIVDFIAGMNPQRLVAFQPSEKLRRRVWGLVEREKSTGLSPEDKAELDCYEMLEHIVRLAKARAREYLGE